MTALDQARAVLPWWVGWAGPVVYLLLAAGASLAAGWLAARLALWGAGRLGEAHWTARARLFFPARGLTGLGFVLLPVSFATFVSQLGVGPLSVVPEPVVVGAVAAMCSLAAGIIHLRVLRRALPDPPSFRYWLQGVAVHWLVIRPMLAIVLVLALLAPAELASGAMALWVAAALLLLGAAFRGTGLRLGRSLGLVRPASPRLQRIVSAAAAEAPTKPRATYELAWPLANAAAFPGAKALAFSDAALRVLDDAELGAVAAHELGHLAEPRRVLALRLVQSGSLLPLAAVRPIAASAGAVGYAAVVLGCVMLLVSLRRLGRRLEERADAHARSHEGNAGVYAGALEALYRTNGVPAVLWGGSTHPHLYDRLVAAGAEPGYPRPKPPARARLYGGLVAMLLAALGSIVAFTTLPLVARAESPAAEWPALLWLATGHQRGWVLAALADARDLNGRPDDALVLYQAAVELDPDAPWARHRLTALLVRAGRCQQARAALDELADVELHPEALRALDRAVESCRQPAPERPRGP